MYDQFHRNSFFYKHFFFFIYFNKRKKRILAEVEVPLMKNVVVQYYQIRYQVNRRNLFFFLFLIDDLFELRSYHSIFFYIECQIKSNMIY
jgi:hypothetical protein